MSVQDIKVLRSALIWTYYCLKTKLPDIWANCRVWRPPQAKDELNETEEKRVAAAKELRGIIKEKADGGDDLAKGVQETFGEKPDSLLVRFIRARKYDVPRAYDLMKGTSAMFGEEWKKTFLSVWGIT